MNPWEVIEGALARKKPQRDQAWLAEQLGIKAQAITNWKTRGVPKGQYEALADIFSLTMEQVAGREPVPWEKSDLAWPFPDIDRNRYDRLTELQKGEIQGKVRDMIHGFESDRAKVPGKSSGSQGGQTYRAAA